VTITIPEGALPSDTAITITTVAAPSGYELASAAYRFGPFGTTFAKPITVTIPLNPLTSPSPSTHLYWSNASGGFDDIGGTVSGMTLTGTVSHFSTGFCAVPPGGGNGDASADGPTSGAGGTMGAGGTTGAGGMSSGAGGAVGGAAGAMTGGGAAGMTGSGGKGGAGGADAGGGAAGVSGAGGSAGTSAGSDGGGAAGMGGSAGNDGAAGGSGSGGTGGADASASDASAIDAAALCAPMGLNLPFAKVTNVDSAAPPDGSTYSGGAIASGSHWLSAVTHYGSGLYTGSDQAQYVIDTTAGTIRIGEFTMSGPVYIGMTYVPIDAHTLEATVVCDTGSGGPSTQQFYYTVSVSDAQGSALTMAAVGSSDVLTIGPP
jgi:hypothetical protein